MAGEEWGNKKINYSAEPYFDDFSKDKNFMKLLFRPGRAVQARELTQLQTILQNQIGLTGQHLFKDGTLVQGGQQTYSKETKDVSYLRLQDIDVNGQALQLDYFRPGMLIRRQVDSQSSPSLVARIISVHVATESDPPTLFVAYTKQIHPRDTFGANEVLVIYDPTLVAGNRYLFTVRTLDYSSSDDVLHEGGTSIFSVRGGIYFYKGQYIQASSGSLILDKYSSTPTYRIGYMVEESITTSHTDRSLFDPALGGSNAGASGADRQTIHMTLRKLGNGISIDESTPHGFFDIARIVNGNLEWKVQEALLSKIGDELAARTYEESGNYIAHPYSLNITNRLAKGDPNFVGSLSGGVAYVKGYRVDAQKVKTVNFEKSREGAVDESISVPSSHQNYILVSDDRWSDLSFFGTLLKAKSRANGMFTLGTNAAGDDLSALDGTVHGRGQAVDVHSLISTFVGRTDLSSSYGGARGANNYNSALVGTLKPMMMTYDVKASEESKIIGAMETRDNADGHRPDYGNRDIYRLYFSDFKASKVTGTSNATNIIALTNAVYDGTANTQFIFSETDHGIRARHDGESVYGTRSALARGDTISIKGSEHWPITFAEVLESNTTVITVSPTPGPLNVDDGRLEQTDVDVAANLPTTLEYNPGGIDSKQFVVLDTNTRSTINDAYVGAKLTLTKENADGSIFSETRTIDDYIGDEYATNFANEPNYWPHYPIAQDSGFYHSSRGWATPGLAYVDEPFSIAPDRNTNYTISFDLSSARSLIYNANASAEGTAQYPPSKKIHWDIDPISGVAGGAGSAKTIAGYKYHSAHRGGRYWAARKSSGSLYRPDGITIVHESPSSDSPGLLSKIVDAGQAVRTLKTSGDISVGLSSNSKVYYTEQIEATATGNVLKFNLPNSGSGDYAIAGSLPLLYPYNDSGSDTITDSNPIAPDEIKKNFVLINKTTGNVITNYIQNMVIHPTHVDGGQILIDNGLTTDIKNSGDEYIILAPARMDLTDPAYKQFIRANATYSHPGTADDPSDLANGQIFIPFSQVARGDGARMSLGIPDVHRLRRVVKDFDPASPSTRAASILAGDVTNNYVLDTGQRKMFYDNGAIVLRDSAESNLSPTSNLFVCFDYFERVSSPKAAARQTPNANSPGFFSVDSYQFTTDLTFSGLDVGFNAANPAFAVGDLVVGETSGATGYVFDFANTAGVLARLRLEHVTGRFSLTEKVITTKNGTTSQGGNISQVIPADFSYEGIPAFKDNNGKNHPLRNMIDFRPYVANANGILQSSMMIPIENASAVEAGRNNTSQYPGSDRSGSSVHHVDSFVGRIDKLVVDVEGKYKVIKGNSSKNPTPPQDDRTEDNITLFTVYIPPRANNPKQIKIVKNTLAKRHTMKDIGRLAKRVEKLEYYVSLNSLERAAADMTILDPNGLERFKNGILVDSFTGTNIIDVSLADTRNKFTIGNGMLSAGVAPDGIQDHDFYFVGQRTGGFWGSGYSTSGILSDRSDVIMKSYRTEPYIDQSQFTAPMSVNPFDLQNYTGDLTLTPDADRWVDLVHPEFLINVNGEHDNLTFDPNRLVGTEGWEDGEHFAALTEGHQIWSMIAGTDVADDAAILNGTILTSSRHSGKSDDDDDCIITTNNLGARSITLGDVEGYSTISSALAAGITEGLDRLGTMEGEVNVIPYIREREVIMDARGLKPNWMNYSFFDGYMTSQYQSKLNEIHMQWDSLVLGAAQLDGDGESQGTTGTSFYPDNLGYGVSCIYEKIGLYEGLIGGGGTRVANAYLLAVRDYHHTDRRGGVYGTDNQHPIKIGYITPVSDQNTGKMDFYNFLDGYYTPGGPNVGSSGWNGTGNRFILGYDSGAKCQLMTGGSRGAEYNGHYTGTARYWADSTLSNDDAWAVRGSTTNTTHMVLSSDAARYVANNFGIRGTGATHTTIGYPKNTMIRFVKGSGAGQFAMVNNFYTYTAGSRTLSVVEFQSEGDDGYTGIRGDRPLDDSTVYSIMMSPCQVNRSRWKKISQFGSPFFHSNKYGEQFSILHLPRNDFMEFSYGRKLVEIKDRADTSSWLVSSYAATEYHAEGREEETAIDVESTIGNLNLIRNAATDFAGWRGTNPYELGYIPATDNRLDFDGKLAVVTHVDVTHGGTSTDYAAEGGPRTFASSGVGDGGEGG